jgi:hypothetical protein
MARKRSLASLRPASLVARARVGASRRRVGDRPQPRRSRMATIDRPVTSRMRRAWLIGQSRAGARSQRELVETSRAIAGTGACARGTGAGRVGRKPPWARWRGDCGRARTRRLHRRVLRRYAQASRMKSMQWPDRSSTYRPAKLDALRISARGGAASSGGASAGFDDPAVGRFSKYRRRATALWSTPCGDRFEPGRRSGAKCCGVLEEKERARGLADGRCGECSVMARCRCAGKRWTAVSCRRARRRSRRRSVLASGDVPRAFGELNRPRLVMPCAVAEGRRNWRCRMRNCRPAARAATASSLHPWSGAAWIWPSRLSSFDVEVPARRRRGCRRF